jgi:hypothetical protein
VAEPDLEADTELLAEIANNRPEVVELARLASVASIVEPALLRRLRRRLLPGLDAGVEADLWFSSLTHVASATAWTMRAEIAALLRAQLADSRYERQRSAARAIVVEAHAGHSDMLRLEDTIIWESVCGHDRGVERAFDRALATLDASPEIAADVVRWFGQAQRRLPPAALASAPAQRLSAVAALHADRIVPDSIVNGSRFPDGLGAAAPTALPTTDIAVELVSEGLRFSAPAAGNIAILAVPQTRPLLVEASWQTADGTPRTLISRADPGTTAELLELGSEVVLRTLAGTRFRLRPIEVQLSVEHALTMLQSLALTFHMHRFFDDESSDERTERDILALSDDQAWATYQHVRTMCEYFTQPIRAFLEGGENPLGGPEPAPMTRGAPTASGVSAVSQFPGIADTGLTWPTFHAYIDWLIGMLRTYLATIAERLGPRLVHVGYAVPTDAWEALRRHGDAAALPAENREPMSSSWSNTDEPQRYTYDVERAGVPPLIDVMLPPILDAIAVAESERPPSAPEPHSAETGPLHAGDQAEKLGDLRTARIRYEEARVGFERAGDQAGLANAHRALGGLARLMGEPAEAVEHYERCLALREAIDDYSGAADVLHLLGSVAEEAGDNSAAFDYHERALAFHERLGNRAGVESAKAELSRLAREQHPA